MISVDQIRAARALLNWTQEELAKISGLSLRALNSIERGLVVPRLDNLRAIQGAFEKANIEFGDHDSVRRRTERLDIVKYEGTQHIYQHIVDVMQEVRAPGSEILFSLASEKEHGELQEKLIDDYYNHLARYRMAERCLVAKGDGFVIGMPSAYRWLKPEIFNHVFYIVYSDNVAFQITGTPHRTIIIRNPSVTDMFRRQFEANWTLAETPWFAKRYKAGDPSEPWSSAKGAAAREWIAILSLSEFL